MVSYPKVFPFDGGPDGRVTQKQRCLVVRESQMCPCVDVPAINSLSNCFTAVVSRVTQRA
jgi:hypothetical protein